MYPTAAIKPQKNSPADIYGWNLYTRQALRRIAKSDVRTHKELKSESIRQSSSVLVPLNTLSVYRWEGVRMGQFKANIHGDGGGEEEWEMGLPTGVDLAPLCQLLIPQGLASAFGFSPPQPNRTAEDVDRASEETFSSLQSGGGVHAQSSETAEEDLAGSDLKKPRTADDWSGHSGTAAGMEVEEGESTTGYPAETRSASKRQRLVWTPELQRRFLDVVEHLGVKNAVPKTITQMMNVEGLTRENVASHLQKYRIYVKHKQSFSDDATSSNRRIHGSRLGQVGQPMTMPSPVPDMEQLAMQGYHHQQHSSSLHSYHQVHGHG